MAKAFIRDANFVMADVINEFEITNDYTSAEVVICWNDIIGECRDIILGAKFLGIPTIVAQHGLRAVREYDYPFNAPLIADKIMVWGPKDKDRLLRGGISEDRIFITGTTLFEHLSSPKKHKGKNVVFAPMHWDRDLEENLVLADKLREIAGINVITKLIDEMNSMGFDNPVYSSRKSPDHLDICSSILSTADLVVGINESTFEFMAHKMGVPVILVDIWKPKFYEDRLFFSEINSYSSSACAKVSLSELPAAILNAFSKPDELAKERKIALREEAGVGFTSETTPKQNMLRVINEAIEEGKRDLHNLSRSDIIKRASIRVNAQFQLKEQRCQKSIGVLTQNLENIKEYSFDLQERHKQNIPSTLFNPLDYPICFERPLLTDNVSAWIEHIPFAMFLIDALRPKLFVELGTHSGVSYSAFCQAVKRIGLGTSCFAIDTWKGDEHAGFYDDQVLSTLRAFHDVQFGSFSRLMQSKFDDAVKEFSNESIDLLHIDGLHTYKAVKHDFETWLPKVSLGGIVLFHDISEKRADFGVWRLWEELKNQFPSFEFVHGHGLGVLAVSESYPHSLDMLFGKTAEKTKIRDFFSYVGHQLSKEVGVVAEISELKNKIQHEHETALELDEKVTNLTIQIQYEKQYESKLEAENQDLIVQNELRQNEVLLYQTSTSWRITKPLRQISNLIKKVRQRHFLSDYDVIKQSGIFDPEYYLNANPDVKANHVDPLWHFVQYGWREGRKPSANFSHDKFHGTGGPKNDIHALAAYLNNQRDNDKSSRKTLGQFLSQITQAFISYIKLNGIVVYGGYPFLEREKDGYYQRIRAMDMVFSDKWRIYVDNVDLPGKDNWFEKPADKVLILRTSNHGKQNLKAKICLLLIILRTRKVYFHSILAIPKITYLWKIPWITRILDFHGVVPEEFELQGDVSNSRIYSEIENFAVQHSRYIIVVSEAMRKHIESKYKNNRIGKIITIPIFHDLQIFDSIKPLPDNKSVIVYAGGLQKWQQVPKMIDAINKTHNTFIYKFLCPQPDVFINMLPESLKGIPTLEIDSKPFTEITQVYSISHYGFLLRQDILVNRVACPTKLVEYLAMGVVPILDCEEIGDFKSLGMQFIKLADLLNNELPNEGERQIMAATNLKVYRQLREQYTCGTLSLRKVFGYK